MNFTFSAYIDLTQLPTHTPKQALHLRKLEVWDFVITFCVVKRAGSMLIHSVHL